MGERTTESSRRIAETSLKQMAENNRPATPGVDSVRDVHGPMDRFDLTNGGRQRAEDNYENAGPDRVVKYVRRPEYWGQFGATDRVEQVQTLIPDTQVVRRRSDGKPVIEEDTIAISIPRELEDQYQAQREAELREFERKTAVDPDQQEWEGRHDPSDVDAMRRKAEMSRAMAHSSRLTGDMSPTHGMLYQAAMRTETPEQRAARAADLRRNGRIPTEIDTQRDAERLERMKDAGKGKKSFGMGAGFDASGKVVRS